MFSINTTSCIMFRINYIISNLSSINNISGKMFPVNGSSSIVLTIYNIIAYCSSIYGTWRIMFGVNRISSIMFWINCIISNFSTINNISCKMLSVNGTIYILGAIDGVYCHFSNCDLTSGNMCGVNRTICIVLWINCIISNLCTCYSICLNISSWNCIVWQNWYLTKSNNTIRSNRYSIFITSTTDISCISYNYTSIKCCLTSSTTIKGQESCVNTTISSLENNISVATLSINCDITNGCW